MKLAGSSAHEIDPTAAPNATGRGGGADLVAVLQALSDPVRLEIVRQIAGCGVDELGCGELELPVAKSTGSHHLKILSSAGVIAEREEGTRKYLSLRRSDLDRRFPGLIESVLKGVSAG